MSAEGSADERPGAAAPARHGGVVLCLHAGGHAFVPASVAVRIVPVPPIARVPGTSGDLVGLAQVDGDVLPVFTLGGAQGRGAMLVCRARGELLGLVGAEVVATGAFDADGSGDGVRWEGAPAPVLDVAAILGGT